MLQPKHPEPAVCFTIEDIARVCHETNRAFCEVIGDLSQPSWADAPEWQRQSATTGVHYHLNHPDSQASDSHESWMAEKVAAGWVYGLAKDATAKTHPCIVPYTDLPAQQQVKDALFLGVVRSMERLLSEKI